MSEPIQLDDATNTIIDFILEVFTAATGNPYPAFSREDVVAIGVKLFQLACMSSLMREPAVSVWHEARRSWFDKKDGE